MNKITYGLSFLCLLLLFVSISCEKKYDLIKEIQFQEPCPADESENARLGGVVFGFKYIRDYSDVLNIYVDTINPPVNQIDPKTHIISHLYPGKKYYWYFKVKNGKTESVSEIYSFTAISLNGSWKLDENNYPDMDSYLTPDYDILDLNISNDSALLRFFGHDSADYQNAALSYNATLDSIHFILDGSHEKFSFQLVDARDQNDQISLYLRTINNHNLHYSRQQ